MPVIPGLGRQGQKVKFKAILNHIASSKSAQTDYMRPHLKIKKWLVGIRGRRES